MRSTSAKSSLDDLARTSGRLVDDLLLPPETTGIRAEARAFAEQVLRPRSAELNSAIESAAAFPRDVMDKMSEAGLYATPYPADAPSEVSTYRS